MATRFSVVPVFLGCQVLPPSVVASSKPPSPATKPRFASTNEIARSVVVAPVGYAAHVAPPSVVASTEPCSQSA
jgi:hypothetical protein